MSVPVPDKANNTKQKFGKLNLLWQNILIPPFSEKEVIIYFP